MTSDDDEAKQWAYFRGRPNTEALLAEKAQVFATIIETAFDSGILVARTLKEEQQGSEDNGASVNVNASVETAALLLRVVDEFTFKCLSPNNRHLFMNSLEPLVAAKMEALGFARDNFNLLLEARYGEYDHYKKWLPGTNESPRGTLFWEYAKKMAFETGVGKNLLFGTILTNMLLKQLHLWNVPGLLRG